MPHRQRQWPGVVGDRFFFLARVGVVAVAGGSEVPLLRVSLILGSLRCEVERGLGVLGAGALPFFSLTGAVRYGDL